MNNVSLIGNLATEVELRDVGEDKKVAGFLLAVDRGGRDAGADFVWVQAWATRAYVCHSRSQEFHSCNTCGCTTHWRLFDPNPDIIGVNARLMAFEVLAAARVVRTAGPP